MVALADGGTKSTVCFHKGKAGPSCGERGSFRLLPQSYSGYDKKGSGKYRQKIRQCKERGLDEARLESIKNVMRGLKYSAQQAMDLLRIPIGDQPKYAAKL